MPGDSLEEVRAALKSYEEKAKALATDIAAVFDRQEHLSQEHTDVIARAMALLERSRKHFEGKLREHGWHPPHHD